MFLNDTDVFFYHILRRMKGNFVFISQWSEKREIWINICVGSLQDVFVCYDIYVAVTHCMLRVVLTIMDVNQTIELRTKTFTRAVKPTAAIDLSLTYRYIRIVLVQCDICLCKNTKCKIIFLYILFYYFWFMLDSLWKVRHQIFLTTLIFWKLLRK